MSFQVHRDEAGLWKVTAPSGQVFGVFTSEAEAGDAADFYARVRGLGALGAVVVPQVTSAAINVARARGDQRPAPQGTDRCVECGYLMRKRTEAATPGWRRRGGGGRCEECVRRERRNAPVVEAAERDPMPVGNPVVDEFARERAARAERRARAEQARLVESARRLTVKRRKAA